MVARMDRKAQRTFEIKDFNGNRLLHNPNIS
jgi:hypothetical protein